MELRELAERVLFGTSLAEKLHRPDVLTDDLPGPAIMAPAEPGRPAELGFKAAGPASPAEGFPGLHQLEQLRERGRLLHFFANHELLATELMALVLLRFPEAPAAFRRGVGRTLLEEQDHTRWYLDRMRAAGIEFGELPVSGYFWRAVSPMASPMDYVAGLSLTFEQANLDYCRHYARALASVGDAESAGLLDRIYRDEIAHVAYGLKWFRRWKNPDLSDWDAFCRQLAFPLSPQRAKGFAVNVAGRRAAGLEPAFIAELDVFAQSKGRTPGVFVFNPFAEGYLARGPGFTPVKHQVELARDLATLPLFLARQDDVVLVPRRPAVEFLSGLKQAGFPVPELVALQAVGEVKLRIDPAGTLARRKLGRVRPWAWGPDSLELLEPLFDRVTGSEPPPDHRVRAAWSQLYSKAWSAGLLREFLAQRRADLGDEPWLIEEADVGIAVTTAAAARDCIREFRGRGIIRLVAKLALGLAGHNALRLWEPSVTPAQERWLERQFEAGQTVVIEPWLDRGEDYSVQFEMGPAALELCGFTGLLVDRRGQYRANWAAPHYRRRLPGTIPAGFAAPPDLVARLHALHESLQAFLGTRLAATGYRGPVGMDAFVFRDARGGVRVKPLVELNPRYTMGRLLVELMPRACPGTFGCLRLVSAGELAGAGFPDFPAFAQRLAGGGALQLAGEPVPRIQRGAICLNDPATACAVVAVFRVGATMAEVTDPG